MKKIIVKDSENAMLRFALTYFKSKNLTGDDPMNSEANREFIDNLIKKLDDAEEA